MLVRYWQMLVLFIKEIIKMLDTLKLWVVVVQTAVATLKSKLKAAIEVLRAIVTGR